MKPNDKAIAAARKAYCEAAVSPMEMALEAAFAAQFPPSEDYAGLVEELRKVEPDLPGERTRWHRNPNGPDAADALEAVLAERDALKAELAKAQEITRMQAERIGWYINEQEKRDAVLKPRTSLAEAAAKERDALLARLAPEDDEALVAKAAQIVASHCGFVWGSSGWDRSAMLEGTRAAIAAVRPHIEAAERERSSEFRGLFLELFGALKKVVATHHQCINLTPETISKFEDLVSASEDIAAAIRSGK